MNLYIYQLKQAYLSLKLKPGFVFSVVTTMGITLGALLCVLTLNYLLLIEPLPYPEQDRLYIAEHKVINASKEVQTVAYSYPGLVHLYKSKAAFEQASMVYYDQNVITSHNNQPLVNITYITPEFHQILASPIAMGRMFEKSEALDTYQAVALISYDTWQQKFFGHDDILTKKIMINGMSYRIVGVLSKGFAEPVLAEIGRKTQVWLPWDFNPENTENRQNFGNIKNNFHFIGRLSENVNQYQVQQLLTPLINDYWQEGFVAKFDFFKGWSIDMQVRPMQEVILGDSESIAIMLLAGVIGLLLIASTNISNLFMSRAVEMQRQVAIQSALGANKKQLFKAIFAETSLLMIMSIILALVLAKIGFYLIQQYLGEVLPRISELSLNIITLSSAALVALLFALSFAKLSSRTFNYRILNTFIQSSGKNSNVQVSKKARHVLIVSQVSLAMALAFTNISLFNNSMATVNAPIGFTINNISTLVLNYSSSDAPSEENKNTTMAELIKKLEALPQVESIAHGNSPLDGFGVKALTRHEDNIKYMPYFKRIDQRYFTLIEQPFLSGENFTIADRRDNNNVMIINQAFAKQLKADGDVIGMQLSSIGEPDFKIIGIVNDIVIPGQTAFGSGDITATVPRSYAPIPLNTQQFMLKTKAEHSISRQQLGRVLAEVDPRYSVLNLYAASGLLKKSLFSKIATAVTTAVLASLVLLLAGIGLYGILSYIIQIRRFEIGTYMAIGAKRKDIIVMVIKDNASAFLMGIVLGMLILLGLYVGFSDKLINYLTVELVPIFIATLILIAMISFLACYLPLRKYINKPAIHSLRGAE